jgi:tetratricopeptide (TPR) repeat protein
MFFKGAAHGFRGRLRSNRGEWLNAGKDGKAALEYIFDIAEADTSNADFQFGSGVYNYFASVIPDKYPIVKPMLFFFPSADRELGLSQLTMTATRGRLIQTEAVYFLLQIYLIYEPEFQKAVRYASWLTGKYPANAFFRLMEGRVYVKWGRWTRAMVAFDEVTEGYESKRVGYTPALASVAAFYRGRYYMQAKDFRSAQSSFEEVDRLTSGQPTDSRFRIESVLRLGMMYDLEGNRPEANASYERVLDMKKNGDSHDRARQYLKSPYTGQ